MSNLLEHLDSKEEVFRLLLEIFELLPRNGKVMIMQPDISRVGFQYWHYFDHKVPITDQSLIEVLTSIGYTISHIKSPFLPYSVKYRYYPLSPLLLKWYIKLRPLHYIFGKQFFVLATK